ncbi:Crp/Fnr family transcriptional regulator [Eggerthella sinensis]|uniref:Crp/Fnr family transcriptional regulator n=1 Tax=Eggerthella sinensis TaxID=242230 RepID=UPI001D087FED|nr:Crp/Fnr family transcriptional regulator [Eggerthella sinensis]MCB7038624.1 Crp/Fnr family transcriptional regulator [Eggerthella sinensis]
MATEQEYRSILIPNQPFRRLKIADYIAQGKKKKLFKGEYIRTSAKTIDDLYYYYIDEGQIVATFEQESGEVAPLYWRNAGNAFSAEYNDYASIGRYKARFIATQNTVLFAFTQRQLYELSQDDPELFYEFINVCHMSFAQMGHRISNTGYQSSTKRMIMWLQKLCATQECDDHGVYDIECKLTLQQLSELLSVHITTCTKLIAALENEGGHRTHPHAHPRVRRRAPVPIRPRRQPHQLLRVAHRMAWRGAQPRAPYRTFATMKPRVATAMRPEKPNASW